MANVKIIDLPTGSPESDSFLEATQVNEQAASGRSSAKIAFNALANWIAGQGADPIEYGDLNTEDETLIGGINELHNTIGADAYDDTATYNTGDYCIHNGELYKCNEENVTGAWDATKWDITKVVDELGGGGGNADFVECTQAEYDAMEQAGTLDPTVMYFITDGQSGGSSTLAGLSDVNLTNPTDGQLLRYNGTSGKWENAGVDSLGSNSLNTNNKTLVSAINELNYLPDIKRIDVELKNQSCAANSCVVVTFTETVPIGYKVIGGYDNSYYANMIGVPIQLLDSGTFHFNYFTTTAFSGRTLKATIILSKNVNR